MEVGYFQSKVPYLHPDCWTGIGVKLTQNYDKLDQPAILVQQPQKVMQKKRKFDDFQKPVNDTVPK